MRPADIHVVDYRQSTARADIALMSAAAACQSRTAELPDPLPSEPPIPYGWLIEIGEMVRSHG